MMRTPGIVDDFRGRPVAQWTPGEYLAELIAALERRLQRECRPLRLIRGGRHE